MVKNKNYPLILLLIISSTILHGQKAEVSIVPYPQEIEITGESIQLEGKTVSIRFYGLDPVQRKLLFDQIAEELYLKYNLQADSSATKGDFTIYLGIPDKNKAFRKLCKSVDPEIIKKTPEEGYRMYLDPGKLFVSAQTQTGVFYGIQSFRQMIRGADEKGLTGVKINDWPAFPVRAIMDDISRGPVPNNAFLKEQIRRYAELKINHMSFYIEHIVKTRKYPDFAPSQGHISVEEFLELSRYARDYHIRLIGNFQSLGHAEKILSFPQYRALGATERMLNPLDTATFSFLSDIYEEMAPSFSSQLFTPNCDEAWDLSRGKMAEAAGKEGVAKIYADHVNRIHRKLKSLDKQTFIWGDIVLEHEEILDYLDPDIIISAWNYDGAESFASFIDPVKNKGFKFIVSPGIVNSNRIIADFRMATTNIRNFTNEAYQKGAVGIYCTIWDDGGMHAFSRDWYGVGYSAEQSWRPNKDKLENYDIRFSKGVYGDKSNAIPKSLHQINQLTDLGPSYEMNVNVLWDKIVPETGKNITLDTQEWQNIKSIAQTAGNQLNQFEGSHYQKDIPFILFSIEQYLFLANSRNQMVNAARLYEQAMTGQQTNREKSLEQLKLALQKLDTVNTSFDFLTRQVNTLWHKENRPYWLDIGLIPYKNRQRALQNQYQLLENAIQDFEKGHFLPSPSSIRMDIREREGQFFQYFLLTGSFPLENFEDSYQDFLTEPGGEAIAKPYPGMKFNAPNGKEYSWMKYNAPVNGGIDLKTVFQNNEKVVAYAYAIIKTEKKQQVNALLGSNDGATVYLNGQKVFHFHGKRSLILDENSIPLDLEEGSNHLLIKIEQGKANWGFSFRIAGKEIRNHKHKYYIQ